MIKKTIYIFFMKLIINLIHTYEKIFFTCDDCALCNVCRDSQSVCEDFYYKYIKDVRE